jgi:two-component system, cell cycle response regulator
MDTNIFEAAHNTHLKKPFSLLPLGFDAVIVERIQAILKSNHQSNRNYQLSVSDNSDQIDILLVNHDNPMALHKKDTLLRTSSPHACLIVVSQGPLANTPEYHIRGMLTASRLLSILDKLPLPNTGLHAPKQPVSPVNMPHLVATGLTAEDAGFALKPPTENTQPVNAIPQTTATDLLNPSATPNYRTYSSFKTTAPTLPAAATPSLKDISATAPSHTIPPINAAVAVPVQHDGYRALIVDDSLAIQMSIKLKLQAISQITTIDFADDGESALEKTATTQYDLIFLDVMMPGIDGYETCTRLRKRIEYKKTPIIMVSGKTSPLDEVKGVMAGCTTYLTKPVEDQAFHKLSLRVLNWLADRKTVATTQ